MLRVIPLALALLYMCYTLQVLHSEIGDYFTSSFVIVVVADFIYIFIYLPI